jgi:hypothetical protein
LFVCAVAGAASLLVALVARLFVPSGGYAKDAISAFGLLKDMVRLATTQTIDPVPSATPSSHSLAAAAPTRTLEALQRSCLEASLALHSSYAYSAFELRIGRVPISHIRPLLAIVGRVREELAWGVVRAGVHTQASQTGSYVDLKRNGAGHCDDQLSREELELLATLDDPCRSCADAITDSITNLQGAIGICYGIRVHEDTVQSTLQSSTEAKEGADIKPPKPRVTRSTEVGRQCLLNVHAERVRLLETRAALQRQLDMVVRNMNNAHMLRTRPRQDSREGSPTRTNGASDTTTHHHQLFRKSLYATSLLHVRRSLFVSIPRSCLSFQISSEIMRALALISAVLEIHMTNPPRIFFLRPSWLWLGMSPRALVVEQTNEEPDLDQNNRNNGHSGGNDSDETPDSTGLSTQEARQGLFQRRDTALLLSPAVHVEYPTPLRKKVKQWWHNLRTQPITWASIRRGLYNIVHFPRRALVTQWNRANVLTVRVKLSRTVRRVQHSKHARHAVKNMVGMTLLAVPGFLPLGSAGEFVYELGW